MANQIWIERLKKKKPKQNLIQQFLIYDLCVYVLWDEIDKEIKKTKTKKQKRKQMIC